jgi:hypothetical protein
MPFKPVSANQSETAEVVLYSVPNLQTVWRVFAKRRLG